MTHEVVQAVEDHPFAAPQGHRFGQLGRRGVSAVGRGKAVLVELLALVRDDAFAPAPEPVGPQAVLDHARAAPEGDLRRAHLRRHDADEIVGPHDPRQQIDQRLLDVVRSLVADMLAVEVHDEHAAARIRGERIRGRDGRRLRPFFLRPAGPHDDVLEAVDCLRRVVFVDLEVGGRQVLHRLAVLRGIDVDADEVGLRAEPRRRLRLLRRGLRRRLGRPRRLGKQNGAKSTDTRELEHRRTSKQRAGSGECTTARRACWNSRQSTPPSARKSPETRRCGAGVNLVRTGSTNAGGHP